MGKSRFGISLLCLIILAASPVAHAKKWDLVAEESYIRFQATQNNAPVEGEFKKFEADITFDEKELNTSKANITVHMGSVDASYAEVPNALKTLDWFFVDEFPTATFTTEQIVKKGSEQYEARGLLTIKDKKVPVSLLFGFSSYTDNKAVMLGDAMVKRSDFGIGWKDTSSVADDVKLTIKVVATPSK